MKRKLDNTRPQLFERKNSSGYHIGFRLYYPDGRCLFVYKDESNWRVSCFAHFLWETESTPVSLPESPYEDICINIAWKFKTMKDCKKAAKKWDGANGIKTKFVCYW